VAGIVGRQCDPLEERGRWARRRGDPLRAEDTPVDGPSDIPELARWAIPALHADVGRVVDHGLDPDRRPLQYSFTRQLL